MANKYVVVIRSNAMKCDNKFGIFRVGNKNDYLLY